jgi:hypothetical protein
MYLKVIKESKNLYQFLEAYSSHNGTVCTVEQIGRACGVKMIILIEKLTNLKYELLLAYLEMDIRISRHL